tara:strand:- start:1815 stop:2060 length:246 start_codon:yes stop_codon:yes gene_type:complete
MSEYKEAYTHWSRLARNEFTRAQIVATAADPDYRDYTSPVWWAMQDELQRRDKIDYRRMARKEMKQAKKRWTNLKFTNIND